MKWTVLYLSFSYAFLGSVWDLRLKGRHIPGPASSHSASKAASSLPLLPSKYLIFSLVAPRPTASPKIWVDFLDEMANNFALKFAVVFYLSACVFASKTEDNLLKDLLKNYNKLSRPVTNVSKRNFIKYVHVDLIKQSPNL